MESSSSRQPDERVVGLSWLSEHWVERWPQSSADQSRSSAASTIDVINVEMKIRKKTLKNVKKRGEYKKRL